MFHSQAFSAMRNLIRLVAVLALLAAILSPAANPAKAADGINRYVSPSGSNTTDCASAATPCRTITYALTQSAAGDTLLLDVGVYTENLVISMNIRIVQNPAKACPQSGSLNYVPCAIIDGGDSGRLIDITDHSSLVSLEKLTIRSGYVTDSSGAGIRNNGILTLDDVRVHDNIINLTNPTTDSSNFPYRGGAIDNQNTLTIRSSTVHNNNAFDGGGISSTGALTVQNTEFYENAAVRFGGGIWIPYGSVSTLENSTLWGNYAGVGGGAMYINSDGVPGNRGQPHVFKNVTISGNTGVGFGGGLTSILQVTIDHSTISQNIAPGSGADLTLSEAQTLPESGFAHSLISNTIISNVAATQPLCSITGIDTFVLSGGGNLSSDHSCDFTLPSDLIDSNPLLMALADNGGHVRTRALSGGSPAIDHAGPYVLGADACGIAPKDGDLNGSILPDVGAFEYIPGSIFLPIVMR